LASGELIAFALTNLLATLFSLGCGGVSAMFVPPFLTGGAIGKAFAHVAVGSTRGDLFAAVGMVSFIAAGYKTPLAAVVFVAETSGSHSYIIPTLIGAAVAYAVSGEASKRSSIFVILWRDELNRRFWVASRPERGLSRSSARENLLIARPAASSPPSSRGPQTTQRAFVWLAG
jgi:H+/Cl- antiporter ClcA